jgi:hypothetical protein
MNTATESARTQPAQPPTASPSYALALAPAVLKMQSVDCDRGYDFTLWLERGEALYDLPLTVIRGTHDVVGGVTVDDLKCWSGNDGLTVAEALEFVRSNEQAVVEACSEAYRLRCQTW